MNLTSLKRTAAAQALAAGFSIRHAASMAHVYQRVVRSWLLDPAFRAMIEHERKERAAGRGTATAAY